MNHPPAPVVDGQAPARRIGYLIAFVVILCGCLSMMAIWFVFNKDSVETLQTSWQLQSTGISTTGTVVEVEQHRGVNLNSNSTFILFVEFVVDGQTYTIKSNTYYPTRGSSWVGESFPVLYDPADPNTAQIDSFEERWLYPLTDAFPF